MPIVHYYRATEAAHSLLPSIKEQLSNLGLSTDAERISSIETESCFNVEIEGNLDGKSTERLEWLLAETFAKPMDEQQYRSALLSSFTGINLEVPPCFTKY